MANEAKASFVSTTTYLQPDDIQLVYQQPVVLKMPAEYKVVDGEEVAVYPSVVVTLEPILPDTFLVPMTDSVGIQNDGQETEEPPRISTLSGHSKKRASDNKKSFQYYPPVPDNRQSNSPSHGSDRSRASEKRGKVPEKSKELNKSTEHNKEKGRDKEHNKEHNRDKEHNKDRGYLKYQVYHNRDTAHNKVKEHNKDKELNKDKEHNKDKEPNKAPEKRRGSDQSRRSEQGKDKEPAKFTDSGHIMRLCRTVPRQNRADKECQTDFYLKVKSDPRDKAACGRVDSLGRPMFDCKPSFEDGRWQESCTPRYYLE